MTEQSLVALDRLDLGAVVSRYLEETRERIERLFDEAENAGSIIFFDEPDSLFGKRSIRPSKNRLRCLGVVSAAIAISAVAFLLVRNRRDSEAREAAVVRDDAPPAGD
jgi:SpoVK/Ycf46/Vps4 family AAA+-type ATPase